VEADEPYYRQACEQMLSALDSISDRVEGAELGIGYVGVNGLATMLSASLKRSPTSSWPA